MKLSLIVPIFNEKQHLANFLTQLDGLELPTAKELIFVDDCSTDGSLAILREFRFRSAHQIIVHPTNQGKGAAIRTGMAAASGEIIGVQDADFEYDMADIPALITPILEDRAEVVYGSRFKKSGEQVHRTFHYLVNRLLTLLSNLVTGIYLTDMETCYKFFKREVILNIRLETKRFGFEPEVTAKVARLKVRILEIGISYYPRNYYQGKKITWRDGIAAIRHILVFGLCASPKGYIKSDMPTEWLPPKQAWL